MPEDTVVITDVKSALDNLEHYSLQNSLSRTRDYDLIHDALKKDLNLSLNDIERLLAICAHDLKENIKHTIINMKIISIILSRVEMGKYDPRPDLLPSALAVIHIIKTTALINKVETLRNLCFVTLLSFPDETLIAVAEQHTNEVMEIFNVYCHMKIPSKPNLQVCRVLYKLLKILPPKRKEVFVVKAIKIWFSRIFPTIISHIAVDGAESDMSMEILELLTVDLVKCEYSDNPQWISILESICDPKKYPALMKNLLLRESNLWHRLWIIFIKLLKHQVTQLLGSGTPINSMLPVVEAAFKLDVDKRCKAFECWNVLIDSFSTETNESNINKRIKLLIIPLKSNNAKSEETALAKFKSWWHLIFKFHNKMDKCLDSIIVPFLYFCFGKYNADKSVLVPGQLSVAVKKQSIQGLVNLLGHLDCCGCTDLPKLPSKIITTTTLVNYWNHWVYSLTSTIMMSANNSYRLTAQQMKCLWKSFLLTIGELPESNVKKDLYTEMLSLLLHIVEKCKPDDQFADYVFNNLVLTIFDNDIKIKQLLINKEDSSPLYNIFNIILHPSLSVVLQSSNINELVTKLKPVADTILNPVVCSPNAVIGFLLKTNPASSNSLVLWIALVESILLSKIDLCPQTLYNVMLWPVKTISLSTDMVLVKIAAMKWYTTYDLLYPKLEQNHVHKEIFIFLQKDNITSSITYFKLCVTLGVLKHKLTDLNSPECEKAIELLQRLTTKIDSYNNFEQLFPILIDRVLTLTNTLMLLENVPHTRHMLICMKAMLTVMTQECAQESDVSHILSLVGSLLKQIELIFQIESFGKLIPVIIDNLIEFSPILSKQSLTQNIFLSVIKTCSSKIVETDTTFLKLKEIIDETENNLKENSTSNNFTTPDDLPKRPKKKTCIVNTVVENGEEYVVVKSNWKFNPRNLTENQKEKLQRKREDIPALYQDLSQSQDEFKLVAWKTDSQDTSNSSKSASKTSKSCSNETNTEILKNMPSTNVVPMILESFFSENEKRDSPTHAKDSLSKVNNVEPTTPKTTKSPRMALKDRVFRNVRNLIEKSGLQKENKDASEDLNKTESIIKTPIQSKNNDCGNIVNSAPPLLSADRPSRVKRKPKKFDELQLLNTKKRRSDAKTGQTDAGKTSFEIVSDKVSENLNILKDNEVLQTDEGNFENITETNYKELTIGVTNKAKLQKGLDLNTVIDNDISENSNNKKVNDEKDEKCEDGKSKKDNNKNDEKQVLSNNRKCPSPVKIDITKTSTPKQAKNKKNNENSISKKNVQRDATDVSHKKDEQSYENQGSPCPLSLINKGKEISNPLQPSMSKENEDKKLTSKKNVQMGGRCVDETEKQFNEKEKSSSPMHVEEKISSPAKASNDKETEEHKSITKDGEQNTGNYNNDKEQKSSKKDNCPSPVITIEEENVSTPLQASKNKGTDEQKLTTKKCSIRKSRIETELAIDMVEGHPFLKMQSQKRLTRKALESAGTNRRKSSVERVNKSKLAANNIVKSDKKMKEKSIRSESPNTTIIVNDSQEKDTETEQTSFSEELPYSEDVIESSQDSTITTMSVKSAKKSCKKVPVVAVEKLRLNTNNGINESQSILDCIVVTNASAKANQDSKDDIELPLNKTASEEKCKSNLTENMDTEPIDDLPLSDVVVVVNDDENPPLTISSDETEVGPETQEIAEADTQPTDPKDLMDMDVTHDETAKHLNMADNIINETVACSNDDKTELETKDKEMVNPSDNLTLSESTCADLETESGASSPSFRDEALRKQDFLNNTIEISPIKNMSPERNKKSPSPETSSDYVVIKLSSPVQSNGEPFEKSGSPEVFTEDKVSPDKRDQSPPRVEVTVVNTSPSSSLSLKKNRPQVRSGGRAAQMLGLCVPDKQSIINAEKIEIEEVKKCISTSSTAARRNLRILYNSVSENTDAISENEDIENFLKFRRSLPAVDSSPSGPILKRKLVEIADDGTMSPASKRKRVSFHDPPVSTTISVQKYIEPGVLRSPQNSAQKRQERQLRQHTPLKSPKRLDHAFKLDTVLTKTIESFTDTDIIGTPDTQTFSLDETPVVEIVRPTELNDTDPICQDLLDCKDPIDEIAGELSSSAMKSLLVKELIGKVETVGDLAKMTELEVNRLCIKAPKVKVARKVLADYLSKRNAKPAELQCEISVTVEDAVFDEPMAERETAVVDMEVQTVGIVCNEMEVQTNTTPSTDIFVQTETIPIAHTIVQTDESGSTSTSDVVKLCLAERPDFVEQVGVHLEESSIQQISDKLPFSTITDVVMKKVNSSNSTTLLNRILEQQCNSTDDNRSNQQLTFIRDYVCEKFDSKDLILFCSEVLKSVYDKPV